MRNSPFFFLILFLTLAVSSIYAQNNYWQRVGLGCNERIRAMYSDTNYLYLAGSFSTCNGDTGFGIGLFDGNSFSLINKPKSIYNFGMKTSIAKYLNKIYIAGELVYPPFTISEGLHYLSGDSAVFFAKVDYGTEYILTEIGNELYVGGTFDTIDSTPANSIARWDGQNWEPIGNGLRQMVFTITEYNGEIIAGGNFNDSLNEIARWDGTKWNKMGNGFTGGMASVGVLQVYKGKLYAGGGFSPVDGNLGNGIAAWDGTQWAAVEKNLSTDFIGISDMEVFNNELYVAGTFDSIGGIRANGIAKFDGTRWCSLGNFDGGYCYILEIAFFQNELYAATQYYTFGGDTVNYFMKWNGPLDSYECGPIVTGLEENTQAINSIITPNPASSMLHIETQSNFITLTDLTGKILLTVPTKHSETQIDISSFANGIYFLKTENGHTQKLIIQH